MSSQSSNASPTSKFKRLFSRDLDCPNPTCDGWLMEFGDIDTEERVYIKCSNKKNPDPSLACNQPTIYSKQSSTCPVCRVKFPRATIITMMMPSVWVHAECAVRINPSTFEPPVVCLRCGQPIPTSAPREPTTCGDQEGFIHAECVPSKKRARDIENEETQPPAPPAATNKTPRKGTK